MVLKRIFGKKEEVKHTGGADLDIENYMNDLGIKEGKFIERDDVTYVKPIDLDREGAGMGPVIKELEKGNIVILNIKAVMEDKGLLRNIIKEVKEATGDMEGDIGRLSNEKILLVPGGMRIVHRGAGQEASNEE